MVRWRYTFEAHLPVALPVVWLVVRGLWQGYMRAVIRNAKEQVEVARPAAR